MKLINLILIIMSLTSTLMPNKNGISNFDKNIDSTFKKDLTILTKNIFLIPRPGAYAAGMSFKQKNRKLAIGPWVESFEAINNENGIDVHSKSLGFLANYSFSKNEVFGTGPTILFISSIDKYTGDSSIGSETKMNTLLVGLYGGYQFSSSISLNLWLGLGVLGMFPFNVNEHLVYGETIDTTDNFYLLKNNRWFPFPGIIVGYAL